MQELLNNKLITSAKFLVFRGINSFTCRGKSNNIKFGHNMFYSGDLKALKECIWGVNKYTLGRHV